MKNGFAWYLSTTNPLRKAETKNPRAHHEYQAGYSIAPVEITDDSWEYRPKNCNGASIYYKGEEKEDEELFVLSTARVALDIHCLVDHDYLPQSKGKLH